MKKNKPGSILIILSVFVAILLVSVGIYLSVSKPKTTTVQQDIVQSTAEINQQSESDDPTAIQKDLSETNLTNLDKELQDIDNVFN